MDVQMTDVTLNRTAAPTYEGMKPADPGYCPGRRDLLAFAQTSLNVAPTMRNDLHITNSVCNIAVSITAPFSGIFIVERISTWIPNA
jgi:DHA2 family multidrug resistance protein-like MFS transporter